MFRAIPFKYTWEGGTPLISDPPPIEEEKKFHPPPPEFTSESTPLPLEKKKKIIKIISFIETPRASH